VALSNTGGFVRHHIIGLSMLALALGSAPLARAQSVATTNVERERAAPTESESEEPAQAATETEARGPRVAWQNACGFDASEFRGSRVPDTMVYRAAPDGACFCSLVAARGARASRRHTFGAWALGTVSVGLVVTGAVLGNQEDGNVFERERGTLLAVGGLALAPLAYYFFTRADRDATAAARATEAQGEGLGSDDSAMYRVCTAAKADWVASREASVALSAIAVERLEKAAAQSARDAASSAANAEEALKAADSATRASEQAQQSAEAAEAASGEPGGDDGEDEKKPAR
jgi:hypothetical protein